ncbi:MAG: hypothetical protein INR71_05745 [Terriglobus roseus]|nr:hypothetical protein [Terriglobus roseus]
MAIARAFTLRGRRTAANKTPPASPLPMPQQQSMLERMNSVVDRSKISGPVELISTTNMLSYNAPDVAMLRDKRQISSSSSSSASSSMDSSADDSDNSGNVSSSDLTDASSVDASPISLEPNHLSCYFEAAHQDAAAQKGIKRSASSANAVRKPSSDALAPAIPQRALSHSKSAHLHLARKRSLQSLGAASPSPSAAISRSSSVRSQRSDALTDTVASHHPFGRELEKLSEVAEELGGAVRDADQREDAAAMAEQGLAVWSVDDYLAELRPLYLSDFGSGNHPASTTPAWI